VSRLAAVDVTECRLSRSVGGDNVDVENDIRGTYVETTATLVGTHIEEVDLGLEAVVEASYFWEEATEARAKLK